MLAAHVILSVVGLVAGLIVVIELLGSKRQAGWAAIFLASMVATSVTGFLLPAFGFLPSHAVGIVSLVVLAAAIGGLYVFRLSGGWRWIYAVAVVLSFYLNVFVAVAQAFDKVPALHALAPMQSDPPFAIVQGIVLLVFVVLTIVAAIKFRPAAA